MNMTVSLIISTYNWPEALSRCLDSVMSQTVQPTEIIIADDGSTIETKYVIDDYSRRSVVPIVHVWHEDDGFRLSMIRNKAIVRAKGEYIIQIDGDVVLEKHFIQDHIEISERGCFVCGSRVRLDEKISHKIIEGKMSQPNLFNMPLSYATNSLRCKLLRRYMATRYGQKKIDHLRGCNMAFWRENLIAVNGYNEDLTQWGHEDGEIAFRLHYSGVKKKFIKFGAVLYHLYHKEASRSNEQLHLDRLQTVKEQRLTWCDNGLNKYINAN